MSRLNAIALLVAMVALAAAGCVPAGPETDVVAVEQPSNEPLPELLSGREALAAAQGTPHILWFWAPT